MRKQYKEYQKIGIDFLTRKSRRTFLLADDMGLGKTVEVAGALNVIRPKKVLIVALASLKINWMRELTTWLNYDFECQIVNKTKDTISKSAQVIIINYDLIIYPEIFKQLKALNFDVLVMDEAHCLSNMEAKRTKRILNNEGLVRNAKIIFALTGTPVRNRPKDFYVMLKVLAPEVIHPFLAYEEYAKRYCAAYRDSYGVLQDKGASNIDELSERLKDFMLRRTKEEVLKELPPVIEKTIPLEITPDIIEVLAEEENLLEDMNEYSPNSELGVMATIRRQLGEAKVPQVIEYVKNILAKENKVVIFAYHREVINQIRKALCGYGVRCIQGGMNAQLKQIEVDLFVNDPNSRIFVGQMTAAGFGVDGLQKVSNNVVFAEIDWVPGNMDQARDRLVRIGQEHTVIAHYLVAPDTLEENMMKSVINKGKVITRLLSNTKQLKKEEKTMTIEQSLDRIAVALEAIVAAIPNEAHCGCAKPQEVAPAETPKKEAPKKAAKKAAPKQEAPAEPVQPEVVEAEVVQEDDLDLGLDTTPAEPVKTYTADDVRSAISDFITSFEDIKEGKKAALEVLNRYGYSKIPEIAEKDFAAIIADVSKGDK
ncbi:MAG: DEAD/DEAH box helicase [Bacteroidales bacterium]|nr:DEAD/DEAH box helicase [Bacteroidales bacterium]